MKQQEQFGEFRRFEAVHGKAVRDQVLKARREAEGPNWRPSWMEGMSLQSGNTLGEISSVAPRFHRTLAETVLAASLCSTGR
jgi:hypothetical protein